VRPGTTGPRPAGAIGAAPTLQFGDPVGAYQWYRVEVVDGEVKLAFSTGGEEWCALDQRPVDLGGDFCVGLAVWGHSPEGTVQAVFEGVASTRLDVE
jgi:hypothetical protein